MTTALGIITSAMRKSGILSKGESPSASEANDGLEMLNDILSSFSNDSMVVYSRTLENFTLSTGTANYTIGDGATFNTARPIKIISAYVRSGGVDYPLQILSDENYANIGLKTVGSIPQFINYTNAFPQATIRLYPSPAAAYELFILTEKEITALTLNQTVSFPPGWNRMMIYNLAVEMAPEYGQPVTQEIYQIAKDSKAEIRQSVMTAKTMQWDSQATGVDNIFSGWYT